MDNKSVENREQEYREEKEGSRTTRMCTTVHTENLVLAFVSNRNRDQKTRGATGHKTD